MQAPDVFHRRLDVSPIGGGVPGKVSSSAAFLKMALSPRYGLFHSSSMVFSSFFMPLNCDLLEARTRENPDAAHADAETSVAERLRLPSSGESRYGKVVKVR